MDKRFLVKGKRLDGKGGLNLREELMSVQFYRDLVQRRLSPD